MSSEVLHHFSHKHPLILKGEDDVILKGAACYVCDRTIIGSATYACTSRDIDDDCENYYLHKSCAELRTIIDHHKHKQHPLTLKLRLDATCDVCSRYVKSLAYTCDDCDFDVCIICSFEQRVLYHPGHRHSVILMTREALFECDACGDQSKDSSYVCTSCDFWIHRGCAMAPIVIHAAINHPHPVVLMFSIPAVHRYFTRYCAICSDRINVNHWMYYCHKCTYFVHLGCAKNVEVDVPDSVDGFDSVQFPLPCEESLLEKIISKCGQFQVHFQGNGEKNAKVSTIHNGPHIIEEHWSHKNHPLEQFQFTNISENDKEDNSDNRRVIVCDGCIQPITTSSNPSYYACVECDFFLHSLCATKLPKELRAGASIFHPEHPLFLRKGDTFYSFVKCGVCSFPTNGFYYYCESCDIKIDIRCAFLPERIRHKSHRQHVLVPRPSNKSICSVTELRIWEGIEYACKTCNNFQIHTLCAFYPNSINHKYDHHPITLRQPPFFHEGVIYCEICEELVDNQYWLYFCGECNQAFHCDCIRQYENVKLGGTIKLSIKDENHTLALVLKRPQRRNSRLYICCYCGHGYKYAFFFECDGCGFLACCSCVRVILGY